MTKIVIHYNKKNNEDKNRLIKMTPAKIEVNFKDTDEHGRIYLNNPCTLGDLYDLGIELFEGQKLIVHDMGFALEGIVEYSEKDAYYVAAVDWAKLPITRPENQTTSRIFFFPSRVNPNNRKSGE